MKKFTSVNHLDFYHYYRLEDIASETLRRLLSQLLATYIEQGSCTCLLDIDKTEFAKLAQAYNDLCVGYKHPRVDSRAFAYRSKDPILRQLAAMFPEWQTNYPDSESAGKQSGAK